MRDVNGRESECQNNAYFGTATKTVSRYSESRMKCSSDTTSTSDRTERFPLENDEVSIHVLYDYAHCVHC